MANTLDLIAKHEGFSSEAYWDHNQWSVGYGSYAGSRDRNTPPTINNISRAEGRQLLAQQLPAYERSVGKYDSTYNWTDNERAALTSFAYNIGSIDQLTANGTRSREEIAAKMLEYNKASGRELSGLTSRRRDEQALFLGDTPFNGAPPAYGGTGSSEATGGTDPGPATPGAPTPTNLASAESLSDIVTSMENNGEWWRNALDEYQNYTYHLELFIVNQQDARDFLQSEAINIDSIISNSWPGSDIQYITIAETGVTTEFNIQDLEIQSLGAGSNSTSKLAGTATRLSFSIVQVGNTSLNDNLMNAALLSGYASIPDAKYFLKVNFKGYDDNGTVITSESQNLTKVFPFVISNVNDVPSSTDARGTITTIDGTITQDYATSRSIDMTQHNFEFKIKETLDETLKEFFSALNENITENDFSTEKPDENQYVHTYNYELDPDTMQLFGNSPMNGDEPNVGGAANNTVGTRTGAVNVSEQIGVVVPGLSIIDIIYDICIQSIDVRTELTEERDTFTKVISVLPTASPKPDGLNPLIGETGHEVEYFITTKNHIVIQNNSDNVNKVTKSAQLVNEIFDNNQCKKIYYYQYTGLNDQILDFNISMNRQLMKAYNLPKDEAYAQRFIDSNANIIEDLNPRAKARIQELQGQLSAMEVDRSEANVNLEGIRSEIENQSESITDSVVAGQRDALLAAGVDPALANATAEGLRDKPLQAQLQAAQQYDPDILSETADARGALSGLTDSFNSVSDTLNSLSDAANNAQRQIDEVTIQALGAQVAQSTNQQINNISENFAGSVTGIGNSNQIIMENLDDNMISTLTTQQLEDIVEALMVNPVIFKRGVLPYLTEKSNVRIYTSSNEVEVDLAKEKFYEAINMDISMQKLKMTIKGDPYWIDTYFTPKTAKEFYGTKNALDDYKNNPMALNGANYVVVTTNKAAGVDELDNTKIAHLATMLYAVRNVTSSFSGGQFVQQLDMIKVAVPDSFNAVNPFMSTVSVDNGEEEVMSQSLEPANPGETVVPETTVVPIEELQNPNNLPIGAGNRAVEDENGNIGLQLDPDGAPNANLALQAIANNLLENDGIPTAEQSRQYNKVKSQVEYYCQQGNESSCLALRQTNDTVDKMIVQNIAGEPPYDNAQIVRDINESGIEVTPEGIAVIQESMKANGHETFNADDIEGITQEEVDAFTQKVDDDAASFYIGPNGIVENPSDGVISADMVDISNGNNPYSSRASKVQSISDGSNGFRSVSAEIPADTLTPIEYEKAQQLQTELRQRIQAKPLNEMTTEEYQEVKDLESGINGMVDAATTGERGEQNIQFREQRRDNEIAELEAQEAEVQADLDSWYWSKSGRTEDENKLADIQKQLEQKRSEDYR